MYNNLALSVFVSQFTEVKEALVPLCTKGDFVFTSLHIAEEVNTNYTSDCENMCSHLFEMGCSIIADVSKRTLDIFNEKDIVSLAKRLHISVLRLDFGFTLEETIVIAKDIPVCVNASTLDDESIKKIQNNSCKIYAMHNYYPRPESALDVDFFDAINNRLIKNGIEVFTFIPGNLMLRGPLYEGLPTLEKHRYTSTYASFVDMVLSHTVSKVFVGDGIIHQREYDFIHYFQQTGIITLPIVMECEDVFLHEKIFTVRPDSPYRIMRLQESREYATKGVDIKPFNTTDRDIGCVTIDNERYLRYSGEIQIIRENLVADERVNVIARIPKEYHLLLKHARQIRFFAYNIHEHKNFTH